MSRSRWRHAGGVTLVLSLWTLAACGGSSTPAQPGPVPTPAPTPVATPPPPPLSVIPPCGLAPSNPGTSASCTKPNSRLEADVDAAIDRTITTRPDLFDLADVNGGPRILDYEKYMVAVVAALGEAGLCGKVDPEGEIGVKLGNTYNEQWIIASHAGWNPPIGNWVRRKYVGACAPSVF
ncbi:MAG TPA: hypothetical protein VGB87_08115 [Vicinamibacteria bacterium]